MFLIYSSFLGISVSLFLYSLFLQKGVLKFVKEAFFVEKRAYVYFRLKIATIFSLLTFRKQYILGALLQQIQSCY